MFSNIKFQADVNDKKSKNNDNNKVAKGIKSLNFSASNLNFCSHSVCSIKDKQNSFDEPDCRNTNGEDESTDRKSNTNNNEKSIKINTENDIDLSYLYNMYSQNNKKNKYQKNLPDKYTVSPEFEKIKTECIREGLKINSSFCLEQADFCYGTVNIPKGVRKIGNRAFILNRNIKNVIIPNGVESIGNEAFAFCSKLKGIIIPRSVKYIGKGVFSGCSSLTEICIEKINEIPGGAFANCTRLQRAKFPNADIIDESAFLYCDTLDALKCNNKKVRDAIKKAKEFESLLKKNTLKFSNTSSIEEFEERIKSIETDSKLQIKNETEYRNFTEIFSGEENHFYDYIYKNFNCSQSDFFKIIRLHRGNYSMYIGLREGFATERNIKNIEVIDRMMDNLGNISPVMIYRGIGRFESVDHLLDQKLGTFEKNPYSALGKMLVDRSFSSFTATRAIANAYARDYSSNEFVELRCYVPSGPGIIPCANYREVNDEVIFNRNRKLFVYRVSVNSKNKIILDVIAVPVSSNKSLNKKDLEYEQDKLYDININGITFDDLQTSFEENLGKFAFYDKRALNAVQSAINKTIVYFDIKYGQAYLNRKLELLRNIFLIDNPKLSGAVGTDISNDELIAMLGIGEKKKLSKSMAKAKTTPGNLREKLMAFQVAVDEELRDKNGISPNKLGDFGLKRWKNQVDNHPMHLGRENKDNNKSLYYKSFDYQDKMGLTRSNRERRYQEKNRMNLDKTTITSGEMLYEARMFDEYLDEASPILDFYGKRRICGTSGTSQRLLKACMGFNMTTKELLDFRLALMGCMIPEHNHSLYEILKGSNEVGLKGYENLDTAAVMDKTVDPLNEKELRSVCKYDSIPSLKTQYNKSFQGYFPIEVMEEIKKLNEIKNGISSSS